MTHQTRSAATQRELALLRNLADCVRAYADEMDAPARPNITEVYWAMRYALDALDDPPAEPLDLGAEAIMNGWAEEAEASE